MKTTIRPSYSHQNKALSIWEDCNPIQDTAGHHYLLKRIPGFILPENIHDSVRFSPVGYYSNIEREIPMIVCLIRNAKTLDPTSIQRLFLNPDGTKRSAKTLGPINGGCFFIEALGEPTCVTVTEGVEDCLTAFHMSRGSTMSLACIGLTHMKKLILPMGSAFMTTYIIRDKDELTGKGSHQARYILESKKKFESEHTKVVIKEPIGEYKDINEAYLAERENPDLLLTSDSRKLRDLSGEQVAKEKVNKKNEKLEASKEEVLHAGGFLGMDTHSDIVWDYIQHLKKENEEISFDKKANEFLIYPTGGSHWKSLEDWAFRAGVSVRYGGKLNLKKDGKVSTISLTDTSIKSIHNMTRDEAKTRNDWLEGFENKKEIGINTDKCFYEYIGGEWKSKPHSPTLFCRHVFPHKVDEEVLSAGLDFDAPPWSGSLLKKLLFGTFLDDPDLIDKITLLSELFGVVASGLFLKLRERRAYFFHGETASNGKSEIVRLLQSMVPRDKRCSIPPEDWGKPFTRIRLKEKLLNTCGETSGKSIASSFFKEIVEAKDTLSAEEKFKQGEEFESTAVHIFATNKLPSSFHGGVDYAIERRICILEFLRRIPKSEIIPDISRDIIKKEGALLSAFAMFGFARVMSKEYPMIDVPPSSDKAFANWVLGADPVRGFANDCLEYAEGEKQKPQALYDSFLKYKEREGLNQYDKLSKGIFLKRIKEFLPAGSGKKRISSGYIYENLDLKEEEISTWN